MEWLWLTVSFATGIGAGFTGGIILGFLAAHYQSSQQQASEHYLRKQLNAAHEQAFDLLVQLGSLARAKKDETGPFFIRDMEQVDFEELRTIIATRLGPGEIQELAFDLGLREVPRTLTRSEQAMDILDELKRQQRIEDVFIWLARRRKDISLRSVWR